MGAVGSSESIVHEHIGVGSELLSECLVVLLLLWVEANVLKKNNVSVGHAGDGSGDGLTDAVRDKCHWLAEELSKTRSDGGQ